MAMDLLSPPSAPSSDESSVGPSTSPTTPEWSPYLPQRADKDFDSRVVQLPAAQPGALSSDYLGPAALPDHFISNVCVVGAGYVGKRLTYHFCPCGKEKAETNSACHRRSHGRCASPPQSRCPRHRARPR
jgi:hypothetical protein